MPKMNSVFGLERFNLAMCVLAFLISVKIASVEELSERFGYTPKEIRKVLKSLNSIDVGDPNSYDYNTLVFQIDDEMLDEEDIACVIAHDANIEIKVPRLNSRQVAAITAGLQMLNRMPHFAHTDEANTLLQIFSKSPAGAGQHSIEFQPQISEAKFDTLRQAILDSKLVKIDYIDGSGKESKDRTIAPLKLQAVELTWYLQAWDSDKNAGRLFKLDGMSKVTLTDDDQPAAAKAYNVPDTLYQPDENSINVAVEVAPDAYRFITDFYGTMPKNPTGIVKAEVKVTKFDVLAKAVAAYGGSVKVVGPAEARKAVHDYAKAVLEGMN